MPAVVDRRYNSFQLKFAAIESHHLINIGDAESTQTGPIILPKIERLVASLGHEYACQIRRLTYGEERQVVARFQVASVAVKPRGDIDY